MYSLLAPTRRASETFLSKIRRLMPLPSSASARITIGLSRRSSVPALKLKPRMPTCFLLLARLHDLVECLLDLELVAREDRLNHRHLDVHFLGAVLERANV